MGEHPVSTKLARVCSVPCLTCVWVLLLNRTYLLGEEVAAAGDPEPSGVARASLFTLS